MPRKPKTQQSENLEGASLRDGFQTPNYAIDLLFPFLPGGTRWIWEPACGEGKIVRRFSHAGYNVYASDIQRYESQPEAHILNFLKDDPVIMHTFGLGGCLITNPPFSLKRKFFLRCLEFHKPFALLIPADYSGWLIEAVDKYGCEKIIPTRRIDYITPNILKRIQEGEVFERMSGFTGGLTLERFKDYEPLMWESYFKKLSPEYSYKTIYDAPSSLLRKYSSSYYHSMWLTWGFDLGRTETFVELTNEQKNNI